MYMPTGTRAIIYAFFDPFLPFVAYVCYVEYVASAGREPKRSFSRGLVDTWRLRNPK